MQSVAPEKGTIASDHEGTRATVFGLDVCARHRLPFLDGAFAMPTGRPLELLAHDREPAALEWPSSGALICSREQHGLQSFRIEAHPDAGYLVWGRGCGSYLLSKDASRLRCAVGGLAPDTWERFLIGQVLPFAALVSGLEIFHASAVVRAGVAVAFAGPSGAGKTSLALSLCEHGACFLADDVLALEARAGQLLAHPGTALAGIDRCEARRRCETGCAARGELVMSNGRERVVRMATSTKEVPLGALFFLERRSCGPLEPRFAPVTDPLRLLAATFNFVLATRRRLCVLLDVCALVAGGRVERIIADRSLEAPVIAAAVERHLSTAM
jgi:hypothetical protein